MMHGASPLPIFLIINVETNCVGLSELEQRGAMRKDGPGFKESDVLTPELDGAGFGARGRHCVLAGPQEEEKRNGE
jgi:hypothetical protein